MPVTPVNPAGSPNLKMRFRPVASAVNGGSPADGDPLTSVVDLVANRPAVLGGSGATWIQSAVNGQPAFAFNYSSFEVPFAAAGFDFTKDFTFTAVLRPDVKSNPAHQSEFPIGGVALDSVHGWTALTFGKYPGSTEQITHYDAITGTTVFGPDPPKGVALIITMESHLVDGPSKTRTTTIYVNGEQVGTVTGTYADTNNSGYYLSKGPSAGAGEGAYLDYLWWEGINPAGTRLGYETYLGNLYGITVEADLPPLTPGGAPLLTRVDGTTAALSGQPPSGGGGAPTYQWHLSTEDGFTPGPSTAVAGATSIDLAATGLAYNTQYYAVLAYSDSGEGPVYSDQTPVLTQGRYDVEIGFIGDSIHASDHPQGTIPKQVETLLRAQYPHGNWHVTNAAVSGTAFHSWQPPDSPNYQQAVEKFIGAGVTVVVDCMGTNDAGLAHSTVEEYQVEMAAVHAGLRADVPTLGDDGPIVFDELTYRGDAYNALIQEYNPLRASLANGTTLRLNPAELYQYTATSGVITDGVHPNDTGAAGMAALKVPGYRACLFPDPVLTYSALGTDGVTITVSSDIPTTGNLLDGLVVKVAGVTRSASVVRDSSTHWTITLDSPAYTGQAVTRSFTRSDQLSADGVRTSFGFQPAAAANVAVVNNSNVPTPDTTPPTLTIGPVAADGITIPIVTSEPTTGTMGLSFKVAGSARVATVTREDPTHLTAVLDSVAYAAQSVTRSYDPTTGNIIDAAGNEVAAFSDVAVTNASTQTPPPDNTIETDFSFRAANPGQQITALGCQYLHFIAEAKQDGDPVTARDFPAFVAFGNAAPGANLSSLTWYPLEFVGPSRCRILVGSDEGAAVALAAGAYWVFLRAVAGVEREAQRLPDLLVVL